jgi:hypothetical protein
VELEKTNHLLYAYGTPEEAFKGAPSGRYSHICSAAVPEGAAVADNQGSKVYLAR